VRPRQGEGVRGEAGGGDFLRVAYPTRGGSTFVDEADASCNLLMAEMSRLGRSSRQGKEGEGGRADSNAGRHGRSLPGRGSFETELW